VTFLRGGGCFRPDLEATAAAQKCHLVSLGPKLREMLCRTILAADFRAEIV
jgi:hypothetical protein